MPCRVCSARGDRIHVVLAFYRFALTNARPSPPTRTALPSPQLSFPRHGRAPSTTSSSACENPPSDLPLRHVRTACALTARPMGAGPASGTTRERPFGSHPRTHGPRSPSWLKRPIPEKERSSPPPSRRGLCWCCRARCRAAGGRRGGVLPSASFASRAPAGRRFFCSGPLAGRPRGRAPIAPRRSEDAPSPFCPPPDGARPPAHPHPKKARLPPPDPILGRRLSAFAPAGLCFPFFPSPAGMQSCASNLRRVKLIGPADDRDPGLHPARPATPLSKGSKT